MKQESPEFGASIVEEEVDYVSKEDVVLEENSASEWERPSKNILSLKLV